MADTVNPQITDAVNQTNNTVANPDRVKSQGSGNAYQVVGQSMAMAIQDATSLLRNASTVATAAIGVASAKLVGGDSTMTGTIGEAQQEILKASDAFAHIGSNATKVLKEFPTGE
jgi:hypothetical protein